jgi:hypothetical protein
VSPKRREIDLGQAEHGDQTADREHHDLGHHITSRRRGGSRRPPPPEDAGAPPFLVDARYGSACGTIRRESRQNGHTRKILIDLLRISELRTNLILFCVAAKPSRTAGRDQKGDGQAGRRRIELMAMARNQE